MVFKIQYILIFRSVVISSPGIHFFFFRHLHLNHLHFPLPNPLSLQCRTHLLLENGHRASTKFSLMQQANTSNIIMNTTFIFVKRRPANITILKIFRLFLYLFYFPFSNFAGNPISCFSVFRTSQDLEEVRA